MARLLNTGPALVFSKDREFAEIESWYRAKLENTAPHFTDGFTPVMLGKAWKWDKTSGWDLPEYTIGWQVLAWCGYWLEHGGAPWAFTMEQARLVLWFFAVDGTNRKPGPARFLYNHVVLQRLKGWGKDPFAAVLSLVALVGPWVAYWDENGDLQARPEPEAWIQTMAVAQEQTQNTMKLFPGLATQEFIDYYGVQIGRLNVWAMGGARQIQAITSNPLTVEGGRPTFVIPNETQNWTDSNGGHEMAGALSGNLAKAKKTRPARRLDLCNAYRPDMGSVGQKVRESWEATQGDQPKFRDFGLLYDSLEASEDAKLTLEDAPTVVTNVRGDAVWLDPKRIVENILDPSTPPSESRRKWYNQIVAAEDAWLSPAEVEAVTTGDTVLDPADEVVMFFDASKSDDATACTAVRIADGFTTVVGMWQRPPGKRQFEYRVPRETVDGVITAFVESHNVVGLWADPSHALDDETLESYWEPLMDAWHRRWRRRFRLWAVTGKNSHAVIFDMSDATNLKRFVSQVGITTNDILDKRIQVDDDARLRTHMLNARRTPTRFGMSLSKAHRESPRKIDLAITLVGGQLMRREYLNTRKKKRGGTVFI
mgnify:CR=1 FL=1